jgi:hypothetical protein
MSFHEPDSPSIRVMPRYMLGCSPRIFPRGEGAILADRALLCKRPIGEPVRGGASALNRYISAKSRANRREAEAIVKLNIYSEPIGAQRMRGRRWKTGFEAVRRGYFTTTVHQLLYRRATLINERSARSRFLKPTS